jgi:hypothetical protein
VIRPPETGDSGESPLHGQRFRNEIIALSGCELGLETLMNSRDQVVAKPRGSDRRQKLEAEFGGEDRRKGERRSAPRSTPGN